ncbi:MAG: DNA polymerase/3'-5' exonuclease PolX [Actinomycetota bacterium]
MAFINEELARLFDEMAELLELQGADVFRVRAYQHASRAIGGHLVDVAEMDERSLTEIPGVGKAIAAKVREFVSSGRMADLEDLRSQVPDGVREMLRVPGLGPKTATVLHRELGVCSLAELLDAIASHRVSSLKGLGAKTEENLRKGIQRMQQLDRRTPLGVALSMAEEVMARLAGHPAVADMALAGSLRRMCETVGDIDLLVASPAPAEVMDAFVNLDIVADVLAHGETKTSIVTVKGLQVDLRVVEPGVYGAALQYFTGSKEHNVKVRELAVKRGLKLSEYGLFETQTGRRLAAGTEAEVYARLGMAWIPPALREDTGEVEAALGGILPEVIDDDDMLGDLHVHTDRSDGIASLGDMVAVARARGLGYIAITDHAENLRMNGVSREGMLAQRREIVAMNSRMSDFKVLHGAELNIGPDGELDYDAEFLEGFDFLVASVHGQMNQSRERMTARIIRAIEHPAVNVIGHPTGRVIGRRPAYEVDLEEILRAAGRCGTAMEVNSYPDRLDLRDDHLRLARQFGVRIAISTDAHAPAHLANMRFGVATAQRGWVGRELVVNAQPLEDVKAFAAKGRGNR